jgi:hypothetical protein
MSTSPPRYTDNSPNSPDSGSKEPSFPEPLAFLPPHVSDTRLAQPLSVSSNIALGWIPTLKEIQEEIEGQARMAAKVQEAETKKADTSVQKAKQTYFLGVHFLTDTSVQKAKQTYFPTFCIIHFLCWESSLPTSVNFKNVS